MRHHQFAVLRCFCTLCAFRRTTGCCTFLLNLVSLNLKLVWGSLEAPAFICFTLTLIGHSIEPPNAGPSLNSFFGNGRPEKPLVDMLPCCEFARILLACLPLGRCPQLGCELDGGRACPLRRKSLLSSSGELMTKQYRFTRVFPEETTQAEYYAGSAAPMVRANSPYRACMYRDMILSQQAGSHVN